LTGLIAFSKAEMSYLHKRTKIDSFEEEKGECKKKKKHAESHRESHATAKPN
jgi:hypothetical protein